MTKKFLVVVERTMISRGMIEVEASSDLEAMDLALAAAEDNKVFMSFDEDDYRAARCTEKPPTR